MEEKQPFANHSSRYAPRLAPQWLGCIPTTETRTSRSISVIAWPPTVSKYCKTTAFRKYLAWDDTIPLRSIGGIGKCTLLAPGCRLTHVLTTDLFSRNVKFSVTSSRSGGFDIKIASHTIHVPKYFSAQHPLIQMVLFANVNRNVFELLKTAVPKCVVKMFEKTHTSNPPFVYQVGWVSTKAQLEPSSTEEVSGFNPGDGICGSDEPSVPVLFSTSRNKEAVSIVSETSGAGDDVMDSGAYLKNDHTGFDTLSEFQSGADAQKAQVAKPFMSNEGGSGSEKTGWQLQQHVKFTGENHVAEMQPSSPARDTVSPDSKDMNIIPTSALSIDCVNGAHQGNVLAAAAYSHDQSDNPCSHGSPAITSSAEAYVVRMVDEHSQSEFQQHSYPDSVVPARVITKTEEAKAPATWVVATAAAHHATGNLAILADFQTELNDLFVHAADGQAMQVLGRGHVVTDSVVLPDVWYVPRLTANLVSVSQLSELDYSVGFGRTDCYIRSPEDGGLVGSARVGEGGLFEVDFLKLPLAM